MTWVDTETVRSHRVIDLSNNTGASSFDTENLLDLHDVVGSRLGANNTCKRKRRSMLLGSAEVATKPLTIGSHDLSKTLSFDEKFLLTASVGLDDGALETGHSLLSEKKSA